MSGPSKSKSSADTGKTGSTGTSHSTNPRESETSHTMAQRTIRLNSQAIHTRQPEEQPYNALNRMMKPKDMYPPTIDHTTDLERTKAAAPERTAEVQKIIAGQNSRAASTGKGGPKATITTAAAMSQTVTAQLNKPKRSAAQDLEDSLNKIEENLNQKQTQRNK